jgi:uncharacterized damage-inducible protein DinB
MITPRFAQVMATYNQWQNDSLLAAADRLSEAERREDHGAFFKSIHATLNHILWADHMWMSRVSDAPKPAAGIAGSIAFVDDWDALKAERAAFDTRIVAFASTLDEAWLAGDLEFFSAAFGKQMVKPRSLALVHMFNHQTHHRGQVHAMLTGAGERPGDTDLILLAP